MARQIESDATYQELHPAVRSWILGQRPCWTELRVIQRAVIPEILAEFRNGTSERDFILAAPTATGKTEAVFLPIATALAEKPDGEARGAEVLYVCPLTVLIDQQARRLKGLFSESAHPVTPWHGSSSRAAKKRFMKDPRGVLVITPESLESQFVNRLDGSRELKRQYGALRAVVIDELHAFFDSPRGYQLLSQLSRLEEGLGRRIPRIGLSATFNTEVEASIQRFLRPDEPERVAFLRDTETRQEIEYRVSCFAEDLAGETSSRQRIAGQILEDFSRLGKIGRQRQKGLVFVNSRQESEHFSHHLQETTEASSRCALVFHPHHGSLSPQEKEEAIAAINSQKEAAVLVCTTTLELGLDIGSIAQVGQINPGATVASLQQRLGRSGRKHGQVSKLFIYVQESPGGAAARSLDALHLPTFQALAQVHLVKERAFEKPDPRPAHLSTLIQQILSFARQNGSITEEKARKVFLEKGPFVALREDPHGHLELLFARLEAAGLLEKRALGPSEPYYLTADAVGAMQYHQFYAAFQTRTEYGVYGPSGLLGKIPLGNSYKVGDRIIFARRLWSISSITKLNRVIRVIPADQGQAPVFPGDPITPSQEVITTMRALYSGEIEPVDGELSGSARGFCLEGREAFERLGLDRGSLVEDAGGVLLFPWADDRLQTSLLLSLRYWGLSAMPAKLAVFVQGTPLEDVRKVLGKLREGSENGGRPGVPSPTEAARNVGSLAIDKHDHYLSPYLQRWNFASFRLAMEEVPALAGRLLGPPG